MKIFVTGGAGFIGSHLVDELIKVGHEVTIIDSCLEKKKYFINPQADMIKKPINHRRVLRAIEKVKPDIVCHLAAQISVPHSVKDPAFDAQVNLVDSLVFAKTCADIGVKKFIYAASGGAMYGETPVEGASEDFSRAPLSPYGLSKTVFEDYLQLFGELYGLNWISLRLSNVYGPRQQVVGEAGVIAIFLNQILNNQTATIYGDGQAIRDFVFVGDVASAFISAINTDKTNFAVNIGTGVGNSVNDIWQSLNVACGNKGHVEYGQARNGEVRVSILKTDLAREILGFEAEMPLSLGLQETANWYKQNKL
jgi:UDP-glucose 4-epimerase